MSIKNLEIEIKLEISSVLDIKTRLEEKGFQLLKERYFERNVVFDNQAGILQAKGQLLRLRQEGDLCKLTFKKPPEEDLDDGLFKVREEMELEIGDFNKMHIIITDLGFNPVFSYEKYREVYSKKNVQVMIDEIPVGNYIEIEGEQQGIDETAGLLGYTREQYITANYRSLYRKKGFSGDMVFKNQSN